MVGDGRRVGLVSAEWSYVVVCCCAVGGLWGVSGCGGCDFDVPRVGGVCVWSCYGRGGLFWMHPGSRGSIFEVSRVAGLDF